MDLAVMYRVFWTLLTGAVVQLMFPSTAASDSSSALTCSVTKQPDRSIKYLLSEQPSSSSCEICWEDQNHSVIARDSNFSSGLVENLTSQFIVLKDCRDYLHFTKNCDGEFEEAHCRVNCSLLLDEDPRQITVNSTLTCVIGHFCPNQLIVGLSITGILLAAAFLCGGWSIRKFICKRRRRLTASTASYTPGNMKSVKIELV